MRPNCQTENSEIVWKGSAAQSVILYPGGSVSSPAVISANQRIVVANPFTGHYVSAEVQIRIGNVWGSIKNFAMTSEATGLRSHGIEANSYGNNFESIVVQSGSHGIDHNSSRSGTPFNVSNLVSSAPSRLVVTRLGKIT